jgi:hypothetical protein
MAADPLSFGDMTAAYSHPERTEAALPVAVEFSKRPVSDKEARITAQSGPLKRAGNGLGHRVMGAANVALGH